MSSTAATTQDRALTDAQQAVLSQIQWLQAHFQAKFGLEAFSQSNSQFERKLKLSRRTVQTAIKTLEDNGLITVGRNLGYAGANLFYIHHDKITSFFQPLTAFTDTVRQAFTAAIEAGKSVMGRQETMSSTVPVHSSSRRGLKPAPAHYGIPQGNCAFGTDAPEQAYLDTSFSYKRTSYYHHAEYRVYWTSQEAAALVVFLLSNNVRLLDVAVHYVSK